MQEFIPAGEIQFKPNSTTKLELETGNFNVATILRMAYKIDVDGDQPVGRRLFAGIFKVIRELKITLNDRDDIMRLSGVDLMAIYMADNARRPSTVPLIEMGSDETAVFPISHWATNTENLALCGHDYRRANKVVVSITWGGIEDLMESVGSASLTLSCHIDQQAVNQTKFLGRQYVSPMDDMVRRNKETGTFTRIKTNKRGGLIRYNPAVRVFPRTEEEFAKDMTGVELGRIEKTENAGKSKGFIMFAERDGEIVSDAFSGPIQLVQGNETLGTVNIETLRATMETVEGRELDPRVLYFPFSGLLRSIEIENTRRWRDDIVIKGNVTTHDSETVVTVLSDAYRQERLK